MAGTRGRCRVDDALTALPLKCFEVSNTSEGKGVEGGQWRERRRVDATKFPCKSIKVPGTSEGKDGRRTMEREEARRVDATSDNVQRSSLRGIQYERR